VYAQLLSSMNHFIRFLFDFSFFCICAIGWFVSWFKGMWKNEKKESLFFMIQ